MTGEDTGVPQVETGRLRYDRGCSVRRPVFGEGRKVIPRVDARFPSRLHLLC